LFIDSFILFLSMGESFVFLFKWKEKTFYTYYIIIENTYITIFIFYIYILLFIHAWRKYFIILLNFIMKYYLYCFDIFIFWYSNIKKKDFLLWVREALGDFLFWENYFLVIFFSFKFISEKMMELESLEWREVKDWRDKRITCSN